MQEEENPPASGAMAASRGSRTAIVATAALFGVCLLAATLIVLVKAGSLSGRTGGFIAFGAVLSFGIAFLPSMVKRREP